MPESVADQLHLNAAQREAVDALASGPLRVIAGPGTGKTSTVVAMYLHLIREQGFKTSQVLLLSFAQNAALEMKSRIDAEYRESYDESWVSTFHSFATRVLTKYGRTRGIAPFRLMNGFQEKLLMRHVLGHIAEGNESGVRLRTLAPLVRSDALVQDALWLIGILKQNLVSPQTFAEQAATSNNAKLQDLADIYRLYASIQANRRVWDFRDVISRCYELLRDDHDLRSLLSQKFRQVIVDEYQDVDGAQVHFLEMLTSEHQPVRRLAVVGDPNQSIYAFRGTLPGYLDNDWQFGGRTVRLQENYRSFGPVLDASDRMLKRYGLTTPELQPRRGNADVPLLHVRREQNAVDEANAVVRQIQRLTAPRDDGKTPYRPGDIAIILRSVNRSGRAFEEALLAAGVPHASGASPTATSSDVVRFGVNALQALADPEDDARLRDVIESPFCAVPVADSRRLLEEAARRRDVQPKTLTRKSLLTVLKHTCYLMAEEDAERWPLPWKREGYLHAEPPTASPSVEYIEDPSQQLDLASDDLPAPTPETRDEVARDGDLADRHEQDSAREDAPPVVRNRFYRRLSDPGKDAIHAFMRKWGLLRWLTGRITIEALMYRVYQDLGVISLIMSDTTTDERRKEILGPFRMIIKATDECAAFRRSLGEAEPDTAEVVRMLEQGLAEYQDELDPPDPADAAGAVRLLTVHASKGMEFPLVFLPSMAAQRFPVVPRARTPLLNEAEQRWFEQSLPSFQPPWPRDEAEFLREEARLGYVATTRAQDMVFISWADEYESGEPAVPSAFVSSLAGISPATAVDSAAITAALATAGVPYSEYTERGKATTFGIVGTAPEGAATWQPWDTSVAFTDELWMSPTGLTNYLACPRKFYYSQVMRLSSDAGRAAARGSAFHEALAEFHRPDTEARWYPDADRAWPIYTEMRDRHIGRYLDTVDLEFEKKVERKALNLLFDQYWTSEFDDPRGMPLPPRTQATERKVTWRLSEKLVLRGFIDRIVELPGGETEIVDYKSGKPYTGGAIRGKLGLPAKAGAERTGDEVPTDLQILIYLVAAREGGIEDLAGVRPQVVGLWYPKGKPKKDGASIRKVRILVDGISVKYPATSDLIEMSSEELAEQKARILALAEEVGVGAFPPVPRHEGYTCLQTWGNFGCEHAWICPGRIEEPEGYDPE
ncbi:MAG: ATP-dependent helicase [Candidatus Dormibacteria bacterium]